MQANMVLVEAALRVTNGVTAIRANESSYLRPIVFMNVGIQGVEVERASACSVDN